MKERKTKLIETQCNFCGELFTPKKGGKFCSVRCRNQDYSKKKFDSDPTITKTNIVTCCVCGKMCKGNLTAHIRMHSLLPNEYMSRYPDAKFYSDDYIKFCSEKIMGCKNPGYQHGGKFSPFSKKFVGYGAMSEDEKDSTIHELIKTSVQTERKNNNIAVSVEYWTSRGYTEEEAALKRKERNQFSIQFCINKYGEEGKNIWKNRQDKWQNTLKNKPEEEIKRINRLKVKSSGNISKAEREIVHHLSKNDVVLTPQFVINKTMGYVYDIRSGNKLIEYNGEYWHCDPRKYSFDFFNKSIKKTAAEIWEKDNKKTQFAKDCGYDILTIWEFDYKKNKESVLKECLNFMKS